MERDDIIEYSLDAHHSEEQGVILRKKIWKVTAILTAITAVEVAIGSIFKQADAHWYIIKWILILMTVVKAAFIVLNFMHLGDERKGLRYVILIPYFIFALYLIFILITEGNSIFAILSNSFA